MSITEVQQLQQQVEKKLFVLQKPMVKKNLSLTM